MVLFAAIALIGILTSAFILFSKWRYQYWSRKKVPQMDPHILFGDFKPIISGAISYQEYMLELYKNAKAKGLKQVGIYNFLNPELMTLDLNVVKNILLKDFDHFPDHGMYHHKSDPFTEHLFNMEGEDWKKLRTKLTPTFTTGKMKMMFETLIEKAVILESVLEKSAMSNQEIQIKETLARFSTDIIGSVAFGIDCNSLEDSENEFRRIGRKAFTPNLLKFFIEEMIPADLITKFGYKSFTHDVSNYFTNVVEETIKYREENNVQRKDFMHLLLELKKGNKISVQEIVSQSFLFYLAGFETSSSATTFAMAELSQNQQVQDKLRQEIHDVLKKHDGKLNYDSIVEMEYLDKVMHESLRKYPALAVLPRRCVKSYKVPDCDLVIEKGTKVYVPAWGIQMDPEYYPNPEQFNPENFSPENKAKRPDFTWLPFGEGPRMCIGLRFGMMQSKVGLITLLKDFKFTPNSKTQWPLVMDKGAGVLTVKGDVWLTINKL